MPVVTLPIYKNLLELYGLQPAHARPNHSEVARRTGLHRKTLKTGYDGGWPRTRTRPDLPAIRAVLAGEVQTPGDRPASASPEAAPEAAKPAEASPPSRPPAALPTTQGLVVPAPLPEDLEATISEAAARGILQELSILKIARNNLLGQAVVADRLLFAVGRAAPQVAEGIASLALERPEKALAMFAEAANIGLLVAKTLERLADVQRVIAGVPKVVEHRVTREPPAPPTERSERIASLLRQLQGLGQAQSSPPSGYGGEGVIDVQPEPVAATTDAPLAPSVGEMASPS